MNRSRIPSFCIVTGLIAGLSGLALTLAACGAAAGPTTAATTCPAVEVAPPLPPVVAPAAPTAEVPSLTEKQALRDLRIVERALVELHPGLFRYLTAPGLEAEMARARAAVADGSDVAEMYLLVTRIGAAVRCGHTWTNPLNQSPGVKRAVFERGDKLPLELRLVEGRLLVTASAAPGIAAGAEVVTIDGRTVEALVAELMPYLRADGSNDGKRLAQLTTGAGGGALDHVLPLLRPPTGGRFQLRIQDLGGATRDVAVEATSLARRDAALAASRGPAPDEAWTFVVDGDTAILTLPTFAFWNSDFDWAGFLARSFAELDRGKVPFLIIDQRRNEGGDGAIVDAVLGYLLAKPTRFEVPRGEVTYERVPYDLARFLETWDYGFFDRTGRVAKGAGRNLLYTDAPAGTALVTPAANRYRGRAFVLIGPDNSSAGFLLAARLKDSKAATLIGQVTGGNQRGINGGELTWVRLPESGVALDVPLVAWMRAVDAPDAGIAPDVVVPPRFADAARGLDAELAAARAEIARLRR